MTLYKYTFCVLIALFSIIKTQAQSDDKLLKTWELVEIKMHNFYLNEEMLKAKGNNMVLQFRKNQTYLMMPKSRKAQVKTNQWQMQGEQLVLISKDDFGRESKQAFDIVELTSKKLVLSTGEEVDKETYTYKALK